MLGFDFIIIIQLLVFRVELVAFVIMSAAEHVVWTDTLESAVVCDPISQICLIIVCSLAAEAKKLLKYALFSHCLIYFLCLFSLLPNENLLRYVFFHIISEDYHDRELFNGSELLKYAGTPWFCCIFLPSSRMMAVVSWLASKRVCLNQIHPSNHGWLRAIHTTYTNYCKHLMDSLLFQQIFYYYQNVAPFILEQVVYVEDTVLSPYFFFFKYLFTNNVSIIIPQTLSS